VRALAPALFFLISLVGFDQVYAQSSKPLSSEADLWKWSVIRELATEEFAVSELCREIEARYQRLRWGASRCSDFKYKIFGWSVENRPLIYWEAPKEEASDKLTLLQCAIHGDELTAVPICFMMMSDLLDGTRSLPRELGLIVQPLLNPDGFLAASPQRPNARGVDINRNFPTPEWEKDARSYWLERDRQDPRKFPGNTSNSEPETQAIVDFIEERKPQKIIAIHTPLGFLELDSRGDKDKTRRAQFLAINMLQNAKNLNYKNYGVWPGSLGNYAGIHKKTPVYTVELPPGNSLRAKKNNWDSYGFSLWRAIQFDLETGSFHED
jgi:murein peptide amidase A